MADYLYPDLCVIGGGPAGLAVAAEARALGAGVIVVEREALGGANLRHGAIPARALAAAARRAHDMRESAGFGIAGAAVVQLSHVRDHIAEVVAGLSMDVSAARYEGIGARLLKAEGRFTDHRTLDAGGVLIRARRFVIATGAVPVDPSIPGLDGVPYLTEDTIFAATELPERLVVMGEGERGPELAQAMRRLGSEVTLVDPAPLGSWDPELADVVLRRVRAEGVRIVDGPVVSVAPGLEIALPSEMLAASHLLVLRGRRPAIDALDLDAAGLRRDRTDPTRLAVRPNLTTSNSRIFAIGDASGGTDGTLALVQARQVVEATLLGKRIRNRPEALPRVLFTDPEIAEVGLSEALARIRLRSRFRVLRASFAQNERARTDRRAYGLIKLIAAPDGRLLGASIAGPEAGELISLLSFAIARGLRVADLRGFFAPYPSLAAIIPALAAQDAPARQQNPVRAALMAIRRVLP